MISQSNTYT